MCLPDMPSKMREKSLRQSAEQGRLARSGYSHRASRPFFSGLPSGIGMIRDVLVDVIRMILGLSKQSGQVVIMK